MKKKYVTVLSRLRAISISQLDESICQLKKVIAEYGSTPNERELLKMMNAERRRKEEHYDVFNKSLLKEMRRAK